MNNETYYSKNKERLLQRATDNYPENKAKISDYNKKYYIKNVNKIRTQQNLRYKNLGTKEKETRIEARKEYCKKYYSRSIYGMGRKNKELRKEYSIKYNSENSNKIRAKRNLKTKGIKVKEKLEQIPLEANEIKILFD